MAASEEASPCSRHVEKASTFESIEALVDEAEAFAQRHGCDEEITHRLVLATSEAVTNAIEHGNESDPGKRVAVDFLALDDGNLEVAVTDEGAGFDPAAVENPLDQKNMMRAHGRGLYIITTVADAVTFEEEGRCVRMAFRCAS